MPPCALILSPPAPAPAPAPPPPGGESRKLALALHIIHLPPVIVLHDPTAGLDAASALDLMGCVASLAQVGQGRQGGGRIGWREDRVYTGV